MKLTKDQIRIKRIAAAILEQAQSSKRYDATPGAHTRSPCYAGCGESPRGGGICPDCLFIAGQALNSTLPATAEEPAK